MPQNTSYSPKGPTKYTGPGINPSSVVTRSREPTGADYRQPENGKLYPVSSFWLVGNDPTTGAVGDLWYLSKIVSNVAYWVKFSSSSSIAVLSITVPLGVSPIEPDAMGVVNFTSSGGTISITGSSANPNNHTINFDLAGSGTTGITSVVTQTFLANGTYTPSANMAFAMVEAIGAGGGGGGVVITTAAASFSGGGGAGGYARKLFSAATIGASQAVTIGAGGAGGAAGNNIGITGGTTSLGALLSATGGVGGSGGGLLANGAGGLGGVGSSGDFNTHGNPGAPGTGGPIGGGAYIGTGASGGSSFFGGGALAPVVPFTGSFSVGNNATSYGAGGSGAFGTDNATARAGGNGFAGIIVITEYIAA